MTNQAKRLEGKVAVVVGGGQTPGESTGNGRATALTFARQGCRVLVADRELESAEETVGMIVAEGGDAVAVRADVTEEDSAVTTVERALRWGGRIDILHNNVGISLAGGDALVTEIDLESFDRIQRVNLRGMVSFCKHVLPVMQEQRDGVIINIGSTASMVNYPYIAYKTSKAGVVALTENIAIRHAEHGIRCNAILPGLLDTPMAIENRTGLDGKSREQVIADRDSRVPLRKKMGTAWDIANAALFLASEEASFITGVILPVDGGRRLSTA